MSNLPGFPSFSIPIQIHIRNSVRDGKQCYQLRHRQRRGQVNPSVHNLSFFHPRVRTHRFLWSRDQTVQALSTQAYLSAEF